MTISPMFWLWKRSEQPFGSAQHDRRVRFWSGYLVALVLSTGCWGRSEDSVRREFETYIAGINHCTSVAECTTIGPGCPLGCQVAVPAQHRDAAMSKARDLIDQYESGGTSCLYECAPDRPLVCEQGRCVLTLEGSSPAPSDAGIGTDTGGGGSPVPTAQLSILPEDGATGWGGRLITLRLYQSYLVISDDQRNALAANAFLETWPERTPVSFSFSLGASPPDGGAGMPADINLVAGAPLTDRWYVAGLRKPPSGVRYYGFTLPDGAFGHRFRPDSHPRVRQIEFCDKAGAGMKLLLRLSESFTTSRPAEEMMTLTIGTAPAPCVSYDKQPDGLYFTCDQLTPTASVVVTVPADISGDQGRNLEGGSWSIDVGALPPQSCRPFTTPL